MHIKKILLSLFAFSVLAQRKRRKVISPLLIYVPLAHIQRFIQAPLTFIAIEIEAREESGSFWVRLSRNPLQVYNPKLESMTKRTQRNSSSFGKWKFVHKVLFWTSCEKNFTSRTSNQGRILVEDAGASETKKGLWWIGFNTFADNWIILCLSLCASLPDSPESTDNEECTYRSKWGWLYIVTMHTVLSGPEERFPEDRFPEEWPGWKFILI